MYYLIPLTLPLTIYLYQNLQTHNHYESNNIISEEWDYCDIYLSINEYSDELIELEESLIEFHQSNNFNDNIKHYQNILNEYNFITNNI